MTGEHIRPAHVAGRFYKGAPNALHNEIVNLLENAEEYKGGGRIYSAAVPHAGYDFSAAIAAPVFKALAHEKFDTIVIIGHEFNQGAPGVLAVLPTFTHFTTPLGQVPVDVELCSALHKADPTILFNDRVHLHEHTIEVQLPFLQTTHEDFKIVPVLFGEVTLDNCRRFTELLAQNAGNRRLFVLSSTDLSHYPPQQLARELDAKTVGFAEKMDCAGLCQWKNSTQWQGLPGVETPICSAAGLGIAMLWAQACGADKCIVMKRGNSGDVRNGEPDQVVGYSSMLFVNEKDKQKSQQPTEQASQCENTFSISEKSQAYLLTLARKALEAGTCGNEIHPPVPESAELLEPRAVFVTLHKHGKLRGCIGTIAPQEELYKAVTTYAYMAGFEDNRFSPVTMPELPEIDIEISVLSPMQKIDSPDEIIPHQHGVVIEQGRRRGLFLPQVWEQLPSKELFLSYLCSEKAHLPPDAWRQLGPTLFTFTVFPFQEQNG